MDTESVPHEDPLDYCHNDEAPSTNNPVITESKVQRVYSDRHCKICGVECGDAFCLSKHIERYHKPAKAVNPGSSRKETGNTTEVNKSIKCKSCEEAFASRGLMIRHHLDQHGVQCRLCDTRLLSQESLEIHMNGEHRKKCDLCKGIFESANALAIHLEEQHSRSYTESECENCGEKFPTRDLLNKHRMEEHYIPCKLCKKRFMKEDSLETHMEKAHRKKCGRCNETFESMKSLHLHIKENHSKLFKCNVCDKGFLTKILLNDHLVNKHRLLCDICMKVFPSVPNLEHHIEKEHRKKCDICGESFETIKSLNLHLEKHSVAVSFGPFSCISCEIVLSSKALLLKHKYDKHSIICDVCQKRFLTKESIESHMEKDHRKKCGTCNKVFESIKVLTSHWKEEHATSKCESCGKIFYSKSLLIRHQLDNHGVTCDFCGEKFLHQPTLLKHIEIHHPTSVFDESGHIPKKIRRVDGEGAFDGNTPTNYKTEDISEHSEGWIDVADDIKFECEQCSAVFESFHDLEQHGKQHVPLLDLQLAQENDFVPKQSLICFTCNETFETQDNLEKHSKVHIKEEHLI